MSEFQLRSLTGPEVYRKHPAAWTELLERSGHPSFFLRSDWLEIWSAVCGQDRDHVLLVAEQDGRWVAGMPLVHGQGRLGARRQVPKLEFAGAPWFDRMEIPAISEQVLVDFLRQALAWARRERRGWIAMALEELPEDCPTFRALEQLAGEDEFPLYTQLASRAPMVVLDEGGRLSPRYARKLRASHRRLAELGEHQIEFFLPSEDQVDSLIEEFRAVEDRSWKGEQDVGVFRTGPPGDFFTALWRRLCPLGDLAVGTLRVNGRLMAYHWGFRHRGRFLAYNLAQLPEANAFHGGLLLLNHLVKRGHELGFDILDASRGSLEIPNFIGAYHGPVRLQGHATIYNRGIKGQAMRLLRHGVFPAARAVLGQQQPPAFPQPTEPPGSYDEV